MPRRALAQRRPFILFSIAAALAFFYLRAGPYPEMYLIPLKGAGLGLLAIYALLRHASTDAKLLAILMAIGAFGDMALELDLSAAAVLYFAYHLVALMLYLRHRREVVAPSQKWAVVALLFLTPVASGLMAAGQGMGQPVGLYALSLGAMAASAWASSFPRYQVGAGAVLVVAAQMLIFAGMGPLSGSEIPAVMVWPVSYLGQLLIATGVVQTLRKRDPQLKLVSVRD